MTYLDVKQVWLIQSASALCAGAVFTARQRHCVVVAAKPGSVGPAGVISDTTALQLHRDKERSDRGFNRELKESEEITNNSEGKKRKE